MVTKKNEAAKPKDDVGIKIDPKAHTVDVSRLNMNLYQKIAAITGEVGAIAKGGNNTEQHYKFIEYAAVAGELRTLFAKYGVVIVPNMPETKDQTRQEFKTRNGGTGLAVLIDFKFDVINADKPDDRFTVGWTGEATDYGDKGTNKAATAALKYYLMRQFNISEKGEQEADAATIERGAPAQPAYSPPEPTTVTERPPVKMITIEQQDALSELLSNKGMYDSGDQKALVLKMAKTNMVEAINYATADAILNKVEGADIAKLYEFIGKVQPTIDETDLDDIDDNDDPADDGEVPTDDGGEPQVSLEEVAEADPQPDVNDEYKTKVMASLDALGLKPQERMRLLKDATGAVTNKNLSAAQWRDFSNAVDEYAIKMADEVTADETPQPDEPIAENENETNDGGELDEGTTNNAEGSTGNVATEA